MGGWRVHAAATSRRMASTYAPVHSTSAPSNASPRFGPVRKGGQECSLGRTLFVTHHFSALRLRPCAPRPSPCSPSTHPSVLPYPLIAPRPSPLAYRPKAAWFACLAVAWLIRHFRPLVETLFTAFHIDRARCVASRRRTLGLRPLARRVAPSRRTV
jgi:hypothetical protein